MYLVKVMLTALEPIVELPSRTNQVHLKRQEIFYLCLPGLKKFLSLIAFRFIMMTSARRSGGKVLEFLKRSLLHCKRKLHIPLKFYKMALTLWGTWLPKIDKIAPSSSALSTASKWSLAPPSNLPLENALNC